MSDCAVLDEARLAALLAGALDERARGEVATHLRAASCEVCLARIEALDADRILAALAGPAARLSAAEADALFAGAVAESSAATRPRAARGAAVVPLGRRALGWSALAAAASVALFIGLGPRDPDRAGVKAGGPGVELSLEGVVGRRVDGGDPIIDRRFTRRGRLVGGESVLFRYRLSRPAHLTLLIDRGAGAVIEWTAAPGALEAEVAEHGRALSLDVERVPAGGAAVWLIASVAPLATTPTTAPGARPECRGCTIASLEIER